MFHQHQHSNLSAMNNRVRMSVGSNIGKFYLFLIFSTILGSYILNLYFYYGESVSSVLRKRCSIKAETEYEMDQKHDLESSTNNKDETSGQVFLKGSKTCILGFKPLNVLSV